MSQMKPYCFKCGAELDPEAIYCPECGRLQRSMVVRAVEPGMDSAPPSGQPYQQQYDRQQYGGFGQQGPGAGTEHEEEHGAATPYGTAEPGYDQHAGYAGHQGGYADQQGGHGDPQDGYAGQQDDHGGYPDQRGGYTDRQAGYADQQGGYADQQGGYADQQGGYADQQGGYADQQGGYADQQGGYASQQHDTYASQQQNGYPPQAHDTHASQPQDDYSTETQDGYGQQHVYADEHGSGGHGYDEPQEDFAGAPPPYVEPDQGYSPSGGYGQGFSQPRPTAADRYGYEPQHGEDDAGHGFERPSDPAPGAGRDPYSSSGWYSPDDTAASATGSAAPAGGRWQSPDDHDTTAPPTGSGQGADNVYASRNAAEPAYGEQQTDHRGYEYNYGPPPAYTPPGPQATRSTYGGAGGSPASPYRPAPIPPTYVDEPSGNRNLVRLGAIIVAVLLGLFLVGFGIGQVFLRGSPSPAGSAQRGGTPAAGAPATPITAPTAPVTAPTATPPDQGVTGGNATFVKVSASIPSQCSTKNGCPIQVTLRNTGGQGGGTVTVNLTDNGGNQIATFTGPIPVTDAGQTVQVTGFATGDNLGAYLKNGGIVHVAAVNIQNNQ